KRFVHDYNRTRLKCLGYLAPLEALANLPGPNTFAGTTYWKIPYAMALPTRREGISNVGCLKIESEICASSTSTCR
ncbi:MAG: hypothetical protein QOI87_3647, partial [Bradyrhizobium sp.]|nr:hypothetical protein [Bradyrhizobium sp.]